jgi:adenylate kinase
MLAELGRKVDKFLLFDVPEDELVNRLGGRVVCEDCQTPYKGLEPGTACEKCGGKHVRRKDDEPESIRNRLKVYEAQTAPVIEWTKQKKMDLVKINATGDIAEITERTMKALEGE